MKKLFSRFGAVLVLGMGVCALSATTATTALGGGQPSPSPSPRPSPSPSPRPSPSPSPTPPQCQDLEQCVADCNSDLAECKNDVLDGDIPGNPHRAILNLVQCIDTAHACLGQCLALQ